MRFNNERYSAFKMSVSFFGFMTLNNKIYVQLEYINIMPYVYVCNLDVNYVSFKYFCASA